MKLVVSTQIYENYGAHDWNGEGECPQRWKAKNGEYYHFTNFVPDCANLHKQVSGLIAAAGIECNDNYYHEYVLDWTVESDDYLSPDECMYVEYSGDGDTFHFDVRIDCETLERISVFRGYDGKWYKHVGNDGQDEMSVDEADIYRALVAEKQKEYVNG